jgi:hypothetical protein
MRFYLGVPGILIGEWDVLQFRRCAEQSILTLSLTQPNNEGRSAQVAGKGSMPVVCTLQEGWSFSAGWQIPHAPRA